MKKRIFALIMAMCLALSLLPASVFAENESGSDVVYGTYGTGTTWTQDKKGTGTIEYKTGDGNTITLSKKATPLGDMSYYYPRDSWSGSYSLGATLRLRTYYPHTIYRTNYDDGSHVQYDEVAEYQSAGGMLSGKTVYKYDLTNRHARPVREARFPSASR